MALARTVLAGALTLAVLGVALSVVVIGPLNDGGSTKANTSSGIHHVDPAKITTSGSLSAVSQRLVRSLVGRLGNSSVQLSLGQYEQARSLLGGDFRHRVKQLIEVAEETTNTTDDRLARRLNRTQHTQEQYLALLSEYRTTLERYQAARAASNEQRARRLARNLLRLTDRLQTVGPALRTAFATVGDMTGQNLSATRTRIASITENITQQTATLTQPIFVHTRLVVVSHQEHTSFLDPVALQGRLRTRNGSAIANRTITLRIGPQTLNVTTNASGGFQTRYRPTTLPLTTNALRIQFQPRNASVYLASNATIPITLTPVTPTVSVTHVTNNTRFSEQLRVAGKVSADTIPASGVPIVVTIGDTRLGTTSTDGDGRFTVTTSLPATILPGERVIRTRIALKDAALTSVATTATTHVEESPSEVTLTATSRTSTTVVVRGRLTGVAGTPVGGQVLSVTVADTSVTITTGADGRYATTVTVPEAVNGTVTVQAAYNGSDTNLAPAQAETNVTLATAPPDGTGGPPVPTWGWGILGVVAIASVLGLAVLLRRDTTTATQPAPTSSSPDDELRPSGDPLTAARDRLNDDPDEAVRTAYHVLRNDWTRAAGTLTHWELYTRVHADLTEGDQERLETIVETYERAAYAPDAIEQGTAEAAVIAVAALLKSTET